MKPSISPIAKTSILCVPRTRPLIFKLIQQTDAAARIVLRSGSLNRSSAVSQSGLQLQVLGQINVRFELTGTRRGLLCLDVNALGDIAPGRDACAGVLG